MPSNTYDVYTRTFAKVASGGKVTGADFKVPHLRRLFKRFDAAEQVAVALAVQDVNQDSKLKSRAEFESEMKRLLA